MTRPVTGLSCAIALFGLGMLAARLMPSRPAASAPPAMPSGVDSAVTGTPTQSPFADGSATIQLASFEKSEPHESETQPPSTTEQTEAVIRDYFPDLNQESLAGWVDSYKDLPIHELETLLQQKQQMSGLLSQPTYLSTASTLLVAPEKLESTPTLDTRIQQIHENIIYASTSGYRRHIVRARLNRLRPDAPATDFTFTKSERSFAAVDSEPTGEPLHLAVQGHRNLMFCLQPGNVLTRNGSFQRLPNGRLGMIGGDGSTLELHGGIDIPANMQSAVVADGVLTVTDHLDVAVEYPFLLAAVKDLSALTTENGILFSCDEDNLTMQPATHVRSGALERSNVSIDEESALLRQLQVLNDRQAEDRDILQRRSH